MTQRTYFIPPIHELFLHALFIAMSVLLVHRASAQTLSFSQAVPTDVTVCQPGKTFSVSFTNETSGALTGLAVSVQLPTGVHYVPGSLSNVAGGTVEEANIANTNQVQFSADSLPAGASLSFDLVAEARFAALNHVLGGNIFRNTVVVSYTGGSVSNQSVSYNVLYPSLTITSVNPLTGSVVAGQTFTRTVTIVNGGFGETSQVKLKDTHGSSLALTAVSKGTLNGEGTEITLTSADFATIGDGDGLFEKNESITLTETLLASGCTSTNSTLQAFWGCGGSESGSNVQSATTSITLQNPNLQASPSASFNTCAGDGAMPQSLLLTNSGTGVAQLVSLTISPTSGNIYSGIDPASITYSLNGGSPTAIAASSTTATANYACLSGRVGGFTLSLPDIPAGGNIEVFWDSYTCTVSACGTAKLAGWRYNASCKNACNSQTFTKSGTGQTELSKSAGIFVESPSDLTQGQTGNFNFLVSSATVNLPSNDNTVLQAVFDLPAGLVWSGNTSDLQFVSGVTVWQPSSAVFNPATMQLTATYPYPAPFEPARAEFRLRLTLDCNQPNVSSNAVVGMQLFYNMDSACPDSYYLPLHCKVTSPVKLHCPGACTEGMHFQSFTIERTSFGKPDNDLDGLPDAGGSLNPSKIKKNRVMVSDTFRTVFTGEIVTSATYPGWSFGKARSVIPDGDKITLLGASVKITDAGTGQEFTCDNVAYTQSLSGTNRTVNFDFSPAALALGGCAAFNGFVLEQGDEVELTARYKVTGNPGGIVEQLTVNNDFYVSQSAGGTPFQCDDWNGNFTMIGYVFSNSKSETVSVNNCTKVFEQSFYLGIGDCCFNYAGGDLFPSEYRNWAKVEEVTLTLPSGYSIVDANLKYYRTEYPNKSAEETVAALTPASVNGQQYVYDLGALFMDEGGLLNPGDDGFNGTVYVEVKPECNVPTANQQANWQYRFRESAVLGGNVTAPYTATADILQYKKGRIEATAALQTVQSTDNTVSWDVTIKNNGDGTAKNSWFYPLSPGGVLTVTEVRRTSNNSLLTPVNGFYQVGTMNKGQAITYRITANFTGCTTSQLIIYSGYDCEGYPANLAEFSCSLNQYPLNVIPQDSELQARLSTPAVSSFTCNAPVIVELELLSAKLGVVKDLLVEVQVPSVQSLSIVTGSVKKLYPASGSFLTIPTPSIDGNTYRISGADLDAVLGSAGLVGITDVTANTLKIRLELAMGPQFEPGDFAVFTVSSNKPCGTPLPTLAFAFDPNAVFRKMEGIGLEVAGDNWASSWADYDGDGHVDLFVTTYNNSVSNQLFKNNGNGTFTKITTGSIATDKASSLASTWGDFDNDGDLDLFVANNIGYNSFLYRNNGNGTFDRITDSPAAEKLGYAHGASWVDYDNDGWLDLFVATFFSTNFNFLFHNNGDGTFTRASGNPVVQEAASSVSGVWGDYDNDNRPDLFVANTNGENNSLYHNDGGGNFTKITTGDVVNDGGYSVGASWGDYDNDGWLDLFVANAANGNNFLYRNNGNGSFTKITDGNIVSSGGHSHGSAWADYDNDGWLDLLVANDQEQNEGLYRNEGDGTFTPVSNAITQSGGSTFGASWADYDGDGDPDLWLNNRGNEDPALFNNARGQCQSSLRLKLVGTRSNRSAIGAKVLVKSGVYGDAFWQTREITAQSGGGIGGQNELKLLFGLGDALVADSVIIRWPSGYVQVLENMPEGVLHCITEPALAEVCGVIYHDANGNCSRDAGEPGLPNQKVVLQPGNITAYTNADGSYTAYVTPGEYTAGQVVGGNWSAGCHGDPAGYEVNVASQGEQYCGYDFGNTASCILPDLRSEIATTAHRIGEKNLMVVNYENKGAGTAVRPQLRIEFPAPIRLTESSLPFDSELENTVIWNIEDLTPGKNGAIYLIYEVLAGTALGEPLSVSSAILAGEGDCDNTDNSFSEVSLAVASFDPNDILVSPEGTVKKDEWLHYKIRFQNVGNLTASQVRVEDVMPDELDLSTLEIGASSHTYILQTAGNKLSWTFPNINLPDSLSNEPGSHGFVTFRIKPQPSLALGSVIRNQALIFFDNHEPIATNVVENVLVEETDAAAYAHARPLLIAPNPAAAQFTVQPVERGLNQYFVKISILDGMGRPVSEHSGLPGLPAGLSAEQLPSGQYIVKAVDNEGQVYLGKLLVSK